MQVKITRLTDWRLVADEARNTAWKAPISHEPSSTWKRKILLSRHSPIESLMFRIELIDLMYWCSVHLCRHKVGLSHYITSQRPDRSPTGTSRHSLPQDALVKHDMVLNAQAIIAISKKRLCAKASPETRAAWEAVKQEMYRIGETELADCMMPECGWTNYQFCPEMQPCGRCPSLFSALEQSFTPPPHSQHT